MFNDNLINNININCKRTIQSSFLKWAGGKKDWHLLLDKLTPNNIERLF